MFPAVYVLNLYRYRIQTPTGLVVHHHLTPKSASHFSEGRAVSLLVNIVRADGYRPNGFTLHIKGGSQISRVVQRIN